LCGGDWIIVTLVTHSSGVSSSRVSRGIHHKCKHSLNTTRLYVSGWVELESNVLSEKSEHVWMIYKMLGLCNACDYLMNYFTLAYPVACLIVLYVVLLLLRWSSTCWCEQMQEALEVNTEGMIPLRSLPGLILLLWVLLQGYGPCNVWSLHLIEFTFEPCILLWFGIEVCLELL